jgi:hypothetical protein
MPTRVLMWIQRLMGFCDMPNSIEIGHLSREEKLRIMEAIWEDLSREAEQVESPEWHRAALDDTERRRGEGQESVVDWPEAKKALRKRFE